MGPPTHQAYRDSNDDAPFSLWIPSTGQYRDVTLDEVSWITKRFNAGTITVAGTFDIIVEIDTLSHLLPRTIGGMMAHFVPKGVHLDLFPEAPIKPYGSHKIGDLIQESISMYDFPSNYHVSVIFEALQKIVDFHTVTFLPPVVVVELDVQTGRKYEKGSLPLTIGGCIVVWHQDSTPLFGHPKLAAKARLFDPTGTKRDEENYLTNTPHQLCPGVCLSSAPLSTSTSTQTIFSSTSAGVLLESPTEPSPRLTVASQGFPHSHEVHHPHPPNLIGKIDARMPHWDHALVRLGPNVMFTNEYFNSPKPQALQPVEKVRPFTPYYVNGMSTGEIFLIAKGKKYHKIDKSEIGEFKPIVVQHEAYEIAMAYMTNNFWQRDKESYDGICGSPIVDDKGNVAGFFQYISEDGKYILAPQVDFLIQMGYTIVNC
jgi:hypothetical protein